MQGAEVIMSMDNVDQGCNQNVTVLTVEEPIMWHMVDVRCDEKIKLKK